MPSGKAAATCSAWTCCAPCRSRRRWWEFFAELVKRRGGNAALDRLGGCAEGRVHDPGGPGIPRAHMSWWTAWRWSSSRVAVMQHVPPAVAGMPCASAPAGRGPPPWHTATRRRTALRSSGVPRHWVESPCIPLTNRSSSHPPANTATAAALHPGYANMVGSPRRHPLCGAAERRVAAPAAAGRPGIARTVPCRSGGRRRFLSSKRLPMRHQPPDRRTLEPCARAAGGRHRFGGVCHAGARCRPTKPRRR